MDRLKTTVVIALLALSMLPSLPAAADGGDLAGGPGPLLDIVEHRLLNSTYTERIPIIDGVMSPNEWDIAEMTETLHSEMPPAWEETGTHIEPPGIQNDSDASHVFWSMYDMEYLYFLFNCSDDEIWVDNYPDAFWRDDSIEICIDGAFDRDEDQRTDEGFEDGDTFNVPADGSDGIAYSRGTNYTRIWGRNNDWYSAVQQHVSNESSYYVVEVAIRLNAISNPSPGSMIGLNTGQNDDDDGNTTKEGVIRWQGLDGYEVWKNETLWGNLYFRTFISANAGNSQVVNQGDVVQFDASDSRGNHPDFSTNATYKWTFMYDGSEVTISGEQPTYQFVIPGTYLVTLTVSDGTGQTATDAVKITVRDTEPPVADAGGNVTIDQNTTLTLDASGSTDNHPDFYACSTFEWEIYESTVVRLYGLQVEHTFEQPGEYFVRLTVTDPSGINSATTSIYVTVRDIEPPVADAGPDITVDDGQYVQFDGSNSTDNFDIMKWLWEFYLGDNLVNLTGKKVQYKFPAPGVYDVTMTVYDYDGQTSQDTLTITVVDVSPPVAKAGDVREINEDVEVTLDGSLSFDNVGIESYVWVITLGGEEKAELTGVKPKYNFTEPGLYEITLTVTDAMGLSSQDTVQYGVLDVTKPKASAGIDITVDEDLEVTFDGSASSDNVGIETYEWTIESATEPRVERNGMTFTYAFAKPGEYTVTLTVTDGTDILWDSDTITVTVRDITPPEAVVPNSVEIKVGETVSMDGRGSSDNVGVVRYVWTYEVAGVPFENEGSNITVPFDSKGNYTITLMVEDAAGNSDTASFYVLVKKPKTKDDGPGFGALLALLAVAGSAAAVAGRRRS